MNFLARIQKLQSRLKEEELDAFLVTDLTNIDYLTGMELSAGRCFVSQERAELLVDGRYLESCRKKSPIPVTLDERGVLQKLCHSLSSLAFNADNMTYNQWDRLQSELSIALVPVDNWILQHRAIKDPEEIALLRKAADLGSLGYDYLLLLLKEGVTELEMARELEFFWRRHGAQKVGFDPIIAFGPNTSQPHYRPGKIALKRGDPVLIDIGVSLDHYHSDMTRVVFFGSPDPELEKIYRICLAAQEKALEACRPGMSAGEVDRIARQVISEHGYGHAFPHGLGHGVGLAIHELPVIKAISPHGEMMLKEGMVITIEPGIYLPDRGGVRIEDCILITSTGHKNLTNRRKELLILS